MRILHAIQELGVGGAERSMLSLVAGSQRAGHTVAVAAAPGPLADELDVPQYDVTLIGRRAARVPLGAWRLARAIRDFKPDLVHAHNPGMALLTGLVTARGRRPRGLATLQGVPEEDYARTSWLLRAAGLPVVACGPGVTAALQEHGCSVAATIANSVAPPPQAADREAFAREIGISPDRALIVAVGRLAEQKNHALAVRALANVPEATLVVLGDGPLRDELQELASQEQVADRVVFAGIRKDARAVVAAADAFVLASQWEGLPLAALEALAARTPVVATAVRGVRELLTDDVNALLVPPGNADALAGALRRVLVDRPLAERLAAAGLQLAADNSEEAMVERYLELYERVRG